MVLVIHDLQPEEWRKINNLPNDAQVICNNGNIKQCIGCFGCWIKTPGQCVLCDEYQKMGELLGETTELVIISKCSFGCYSSFVKNVLDRSISYILPYFVLRKKEMHHKSRYVNRLKIQVFFYGEEITEEEKKTANKLVMANAINLNATVKKVAFSSDIARAREVLTW